MFPESAVSWGFCTSWFLQTALQELQPHYMYICCLYCSSTTSPPVPQSGNSSHLDICKTCTAQMMPYLASSWKCIEDAPEAWHQWVLSATWVNLRKLPYVILWNRILAWDSLCSGTCVSWTIFQWKFKKWDCAFFHFIENRFFLT